MKKSMTFEETKRKYVHRFTMEHVPEWAIRIRLDGKYYAPQYASDREWFEKSLFPPNNPFSRTSCHSSGESWPLGKELDAPFVKGVGK